MYDLLQGRRHPLLNFHSEHVHVPPSDVKKMVWSVAHITVIQIVALPVKIVEKKNKLSLEISISPFCYLFLHIFGVIFPIQFDFPIFIRTQQHYLYTNYKDKINRKKQLFVIKFHAQFDKWRNIIQKKETTSGNYTKSLGAHKSDYSAANRQQPKESTKT